jgi:hypothetical protein
MHLSAGITTDTRFVSSALTVVPKIIGNTGQSLVIDGVKRPFEVYDCRQRIRIQQDGTVLPFENKDPGQLICGFFKKS